jgi:hypothetical protein
LRKIRQFGKALEGEDPLVSHALDEPGGIDLNGEPVTLPGSDQGILLHSPSTLLLGPERR